MFHAVHRVTGGLAFVQPWISCGAYALVAAIWLAPDRRFEKLLAKEGRPGT